MLFEATSSFQAVNPMKIVLLDFADQQIAELKHQFPKVNFLPLGFKQPLPEESPDAVVAWTRSAFDEIFVPATWRQHPSVRWYHAPGAGIEFYLHPGLAEQPFVMTNGKLTQGPEVSEHAVALLLSLTRRLCWEWKGVPAAQAPRAIELRGKTALILGFGGIGMLVGEKLAAFGMRIQAVTEDNFAFVSFVERRWLSDQLLDALPLADVVIMAAPLTSRSRRMMNADAFAAMKDGAYFVNISRGGTVDTDALVEAVRSGKLAGAGLDVTDPEPLPDDHALHSFPNVMLQPHLAGISDRLRERNFELIATNIRRFVTGLPLVNIVDKVREY